MKIEEVLSDLYKSTWRFFSSVKLTVFVLLSLAITSIIGTLIPQNETPAEYVRAFGEFYYRVFHVLDMFDMYHSWWFQLLLVLLTVNVIVCSVDRLSSTWKTIFVSIPHFNVSRFRRLTDTEEFSVMNSPGSLEKIYEPVVSKLFSYCRIEKTDKGVCIFSEKGRWARLGVYAVHLSIVVLLMGGLIGSIFGFEGFVNIPEGESVNVVEFRGDNMSYPLNFEVRCDDFSIRFYDTGMPSEYRSSLSILEKGKVVLKKDIIVNDPLRYKGINLFQSSYGAMGPQEISLKFESEESGMTYKKTVRLGQKTNIPEDLGKFVIKDYRNSYTFRGQNIGEVFLGTLFRKNKAPVNIVLPTRFPRFDKMRKGNSVISVSDYKARYYTGLQVTKDPGVWVVYVGFMIMIIGCFIAFFISHQRLCIEIIQSKNSSRIIVAGMANKNKFGMHQKVKKIADRLKAL